MYTCIIIDDEPDAREVLQDIIKNYCPNIEILALCEDVPSAVKAIHTLKPNIVISDIDMPVYNGFQLLDFVDKKDFELIYCTAYNEFAMRAFEVSAIGYILKPIQISKLTIAIEKAMALCENTKDSDIRIDVLKDTIQNHKINKIALPMGDGLHFVHTEDIMYMCAEGAYTQVVTTTNSYLVCKKLKEFESLLATNQEFFRIHRSYIIHTNYISQYIKSDGGNVTMQNQFKIPVARERKDDFVNLLQKNKV